MRIKKIADQIIVIIAVIFLICKAIDGPLRYYLAINHLEVFVYIPQGLMFLAIILYPLVIGRFSILYLGTLLLGGIYVGISFIFISNILQTFFGIYILLAVLFGMIFYKSFQVRYKKLNQFFLILFILVVAGVFINSVINFPWSGFNFSIGNLSIGVSRKWSTIGFIRFAGFSRASFNAACEILLLGMYLITVMESRFLRFLVWIVAGVAILFTTTKGIMAAYIIISVFIVLYKWLPKPVWISLLVGLLMIDILIPVSAVFYSYSLSFNSKFNILLFKSFGDRLTWMWPDCFELALNYGNILLGRGIGGIGVPQLYFEKNLYLPGDNIFVYLFVLFGVFALPILFTYVYGSLFLKIRNDSLDRYFYMIVLASLTYGLTANVIEEPYFSFFLGITISHIFNRWVGRHKYISLNVSETTLKTHYKTTDK